MSRAGLAGYGLFKRGGQQVLWLWSVTTRTQSLLGRAGVGAAT